MSSLIGNQGMRGFGDKIPKGYEKGTIQQFTPDQLNLFQSLFSNVGPDSFLSKIAGGDQGAFNQMEAPAQRQFQGMQSQIASRFSGMGLGARKSSGFQNAMNQASSDFAQDLQSRRVELQRQALKDLTGMSSMLLGQRPQEKFLSQKSKPWWQELLMGAGEGLAQGFGKAAGSAFGGLF